MDKKEIKQLSKIILEKIYDQGYIETIYNTKDENHRKNGWIMKNKLWSPWYFNVRPMGATPGIVAQIGYVMNHMLRDKDEIPDLNQIVAVEMAGIPLASAISTACGAGCELIPYAYTRPLPGEKVRTPEEAEKILSELKEDPHGYGGKEFVEGRFQNGDVMCIVDDVVTGFGSKLIAKLIIEYEMKRRGIEKYTIDHVGVVMDREQGAEEEAKKHGMKIHSLIKFKTEGLEWIKDIMSPQDYQVISDYLEDPTKYQDLDFQKKLLADVAR